MTQKTFLLVGIFLAFLAVALGAFAAHAMRSRYPADLLGTFEVAVRYQMYHALGLIACASFMTPLAGGLMIAGTLIFSGSLYALVFSGVRGFGMITPIGGVLLLLSWLFLAIGVLRS